MTDYSAIPDELKDREQWLLWDSSADTPRRPHWAGNFGISWSDPDDWHSFEEAVETASEHDSWGIGYVMALDNDDHAHGVYGCLDLDGCVDENGGPKDWLPSLERFIQDGAYMEYSASGEGIHIPLVGQQPPEWWADSHFSADEHEGVEYLTNKFVAFTADAMDGCAGQPVADTNPAPFLFEAYQELNGEAPAMDVDGDQGGYDGGDDLTKQQVENALDALDPGYNYPKWRNLAFAVHDWDDGSTGKAVFESWSRGSSAWDGQSQRLIERIWDDSEQGGGITVGTLIHHATEAGWSPNQKTQQTPPSSKDAADDAEMAESDGGAAATQPTTHDDSPTNGDEHGVSWADIRNMLRSAEDSDERRTPRFEAAMKIDEERSFANLIESDTLYVYQEADGIYDATGEAEVRQLLGEGLEEQFTATAKNQALEHIRGRNSLRQEEMGGPAWKIAADNCVIDLGENKQLNHDPAFRFMSQLGCEFDPEAEAPRWEQFLEEVVPKESDRKKLQEFAGYTLHHWDLPYHKALFLVGPTASGKSTFLDTINAMLGDGTTASLTPQQMTSERFAGAELFEKWANIRNDIPKATVENTGTFKEIVGGDPLKAEKKYQDPFRFEPTAKMLFSANQLPETEVDDEAFYRRILLVPFPETIPVEQRDKKLDDKLQAELPGVLNWAIDGLQRLVDQGGFTADRSPGHTADTWQKWGDSVSRFASDAVEDAPEDEAIPKSKLYAAYLEYCRQEGIPSDTQHSMTSGLKEEGFQDDRVFMDGSQKRSFLGMAWTGRGRELLEDADDRSASNGDGRAGGLDDF